MDHTAVVVHGESPDSVPPVLPDDHLVGVYLVERYGVGLTAEQVAAESARIQRAGAVEHLLSLVVPGDEGALCVFEAATLAEVERAAEAAGVQVERVVEVALERPTPTRPSRSGRPAREDEPPRQEVRQ